MIILDLIQNIALLMALALVQQVLPEGAAARFFRNHPFGLPVLKGLVFGGMGIVVMMTPLHFAPGVIFDGRSILLAVAGMFGGPVVATIAAVMCGAYRLWLGGGGTPMGIGVICEASLLGVVFHHLRARNPHLTDYLPLWGFGLLVHAAMMALMLFLPAETRWEVIWHIGPVVLLLYPLATLFVCRLFLDQETRSRAEAALGESEAKYRELVESANSIILRWNLSGKITFLNEYGSRFFGYSQEELVGRSLLGTIVPATDSTGKDLAKMVRDIASCPRDHESSQNENMCKDGTRVWVAWTNRPILDDQGQCVEILAVGNDITERKRTEMALQESEEKFRNLFNNAEAGMFRTRMDGSEVLDVNDKYLSILGETRGELVGKPSAILWADPKEREKMVKTLKAQGQVNDLECRLLNRAGEEKYCLTSLRLYPETGILDGSIVDITERKQAEEALRQSEATLASILDTTSDGVLAVSNDGRIIRTNRNLGLMLHIPQAMLDAKDDRPVLDSVVDQVVNPDAFLRKVRALYKSNDKDMDEIVFKDGRIFERYSAPLTTADSVIGRVWFFHDITARRRVEKDYRTLFLEMMEGFALHEIICDETGVPKDYRFLAVNPAFERMTGLKKEAIVGRTVLEILPGTERDWIEIYGRVALTGEPARFERYASDLNKHFEVTAFRPVANQFACIFSDITERKQAENALRESEWRLKDILFSMAEWVWEIDENGLYTYSSQKGFEFFGPARQDIIGKTPFDLMPAKEAKRVGTIFADIMARKAPIKDLENWNMAKNGELICLLTNGVPVLDEKGNLKGYRGVDTDITARKRAERELESYAADLRTSNEYMTRFNQAATGRELRMIELKREINDLCVRFGQPPRYAVEFADTTTTDTPAVRPESMEPGPD